ncbi:hypothetical protein J22TS3_32240 [Paenibacillus sp. J22TS3]|nr:hypothetical protein J22TS3_32240 [Paenibacillus sp. J22TS3]
MKTGEIIGDFAHYYTDFAAQLPQDTVILTAGCAKYKYNKLDLGEIGRNPAGSRRRAVQ